MLSRPRAGCGCTLHAASLHWLQAVLSRPHLIHNSLVIISSLVTASQVCHMHHCSMRDDGSLDSCYSYGRAIAATSAPGRGSTLPHLRRDGARPCHICAGTGLTPATSAPGLGSSRLVSLTLQLGLVIQSSHRLAYFFLLLANHVVLALCIFGRRRAKTELAQSQSE